MSTHLHPAQPVPVPMPPGETSYATAAFANYETEIHIAGVGQGDLDMQCQPQLRNTRAKHASQHTRLFATTKVGGKIEQKRKKKNHWQKQRERGTGRHGKNENEAPQTSSNYSEVSRRLSIGIGWLQDSPSGRVWRKTPEMSQVDKGKHRRSDEATSRYDDACYDDRGAALFFFVLPLNSGAQDLS